MRVVLEFDENSTVALQEQQTLQMYIELTEAEKTMPEGHIIPLLIGMYKCWNDCRDMLAEQYIIPMIANGFSMSKENAQQCLEMSMKDITVGEKFALSQIPLNDNKNGTEKMFYKTKLK